MILLQCFLSSQRNQEIVIIYKLSFYPHIGFQESLEMSQEFVSGYGIEQTTDIAMAVNGQLDQEHKVNQKSLEQMEKT